TPPLYPSPASGEDKSIHPPPLAGRVGRGLPGQSPDRVGGGNDTGETRGKVGRSPGLPLPFLSCSIPLRGACERSIGLPICPVGPRPFLVPSGGARRALASTRGSMRRRSLP